jgi:hypothetical protein
MGGDRLVGRTIDGYGKFDANVGHAPLEQAACHG